LGAKIGITIVIACAAWVLIALGFIRLLRSGRDVISGAGYILIGCGSWLATALLWINGG
jgi:hypothetical protein